MVANNPSMDDGYRYPRTYVSEWNDIGSRTIDNGHRFIFRVDPSGVVVVREFGTWSVGDLFGDMGYWPEEEVWTGHEQSLRDLLLHVCELTGARYDDLEGGYEDFYLHYEDRERLVAYLDQEIASEGNDNVMQDLRSAFANEIGSLRIGGFPSEDFQAGTCYRGLIVKQTDRGWTGVLTGPSKNHEYFVDHIFRGGTVEEVVLNTDPYGQQLRDFLPWTPRELSHVLCQEDTRWAEFLSGCERESW